MNRLYPLTPPAPVNSRRVAFTAARDMRKETDFHSQAAGPHMLKNELRDILAGKKADDAWLECLTLRREADTLYVGFPHMYYADWFNRHKKALFEEILTSRFGAGAFPEIIYEQNTPGQTRIRRSAPGEPATPGFGVLHAAPSPADRLLHENPDTAGDDPFAAFIANSKNAFPLAAAREVAEQQAGEAYTPFLLCGRSGTGKSHILRSMAVTLAQRGRRVMFAVAARFCAENPLWAPRPELFWQQYDALLLDDIQDLAGQTAWQRNLAACIDACPQGEQQNRRMAFTCLGPAQTLKTLDERLRSRLESGLVVELMEPDLEVRMRYLQAMNREQGLNMNREQLLFIAQRCSQFRLLQGLLRKVAVFCSVTGCELSPSDLENIIRTSVADKTPGCLEILGDVARAMHVRPEDVLGSRRSPELVRARQLAMYICRKKLGLSYPELGRAFGGKDHSTVIHAVKKIKKLLLVDKSVEQFLTTFERNAQ